MEKSAMKDIFSNVLGKPFGIVLYQLLDATQYTIYLSLIALIGGGIIALIITIVRTSPYTTAKRVAAGYIWLFQSVPLLMLLFLIGLGVPRILEFNINPWLAAGIALVLYASAYLADVWRGAVESIPVGQWEGARALGMPFLKIVRQVILPQAVRISLAPTIGFTVQIIKGTSLAYIIGFYDLMSIGKRWANAPVSGTEPYIIFPLMALIYFCLCFPLSVWARGLERRLGAISSKKPPKVA